MPPETNSGPTRASASLFGRGDHYDGAPIGILAIATTKKKPRRGARGG